MDYDRDIAENDWRSYATRQMRIKAVQTLTGSASDYTAVDFEQSETATGRVMWTKPAIGAGPWTKQSYDLQGRLISSETYENGSTTIVLSKTTQHYDDSATGGGRLVESRVYESDGSGGLTTNYIATSYDYDDVGRQVKNTSAGQGFTKTAFDVFGRTLRTIRASEEGTTTDVHGANAFTDDMVLAETVYEYDDAGNVLVVTQYDRHHDAGGSVRGLLSDPFNSGQSRVTHTATWYDQMHRPTHVVEYGTNTP